MNHPLSKPQRTQLENTIQNARDAAEKAVQTALDRLGVDQEPAPAYLDNDEKTLRNRLRVHARALGGDLKLRREIAYEHWHRMLFARFLAESGLLTHPEFKAPVTLVECAELAKETGVRSPWVLAGQYASVILPQVFRADSPGLSLVLSRENEKQLETLLESLPTEVFTASDSLGWVYQFWQSKTKDEVNASGNKIGADELSAVTQLFTEPYMVAFLIDNTLGAWWAGRTLTDDDWLSAPNEAALRAKTAVPGLTWDYLRFVKEDERWRPAAGTFAHWPEQMKDLKILDPSCGSGHFLTALLEKLVPLRRKAEGLTPAGAVDAVLRDNLHGLELDQRCVELAAFALAFAAWRVPQSVGYRPLPELNLAWVGQRPSGTKEQWTELGLGKQDLKILLEHLYGLFEKAPVLGSLINPDDHPLTLFGAAGANTELAEILNRPFANKSPEEREASVSAQGLQKAAALLSARFNWVITNVPYLAGGKQDEPLRDFCQRDYEESKADLATVFLERSLKFGPKVTVSLVMPQNWLFLTSYKKLREKLLNQQTWNVIARLGPGAFETISGEVVKAILITISRGNVNVGKYAGTAPSVALKLAGVEADARKTPAEKAGHLASGPVVVVGQDAQLGNPDARVLFTEESSVKTLLELYADSNLGLHVGDWEHYRRDFWDSGFGNDRDWRSLQNAVVDFSPFAGLDDVLLWPNEGAVHINNPSARVQGRPAWGKRGVAVSLMSHLPACLYSGGLFRNGVGVITPKRPEHLPALWAFVSSSEFNAEVRKIDQKLYVTCGTLLKVPFDLDHWTKVAAERYPNGLPQPYSDDPTQWIFHGHPATSTSPLQVALARLVGYRWPAENDTGMELSPEALAQIAKTQTLAHHFDDDGIVCLSALNHESPAVDRVRALLSEAFGGSYNEEGLLAQANCPGYTLAEYLRDKAFEDHCKLFHHRPFVWHITDGHRDGFSAFVNYHKLDAAGLDRLIYSYLGDHIHRLESGGASVADAETKLVHAYRLKEKLEKIKVGEAPYDIFVRWKSLKDLPIGWNPDLNDGVRMNIRPFMTAEVLKVNKPPKLNVKWDKDRGKDVASAPWFGVHGGDRINDHHTALV
ncbi:MAG: hypothetical protein WCG80_15235, partial [Spirochaetales bacterium]